MTDQTDLTAFERAIRNKLGLIKPHPKPEPVKPKSIPKVRTPAMDWFAEAHPEYNEDQLRVLRQEF